MAIYKGNKKVVAVYKGSTPINKIYKGSTLVFQKGGGSQSVPVIITFTDDSSPANRQYKPLCEGGTKTATSQTIELPSEGETYTFVNNNTLLEVRDYSNNCPSVTSFSRLFNGAKNIKTLTFAKGMDTSNIESMDNMFRGCSSLVSLDLSSFDIHNCTKIYTMFSGCKSLVSLDVSSFDTSQCGDFSYMFYYCSSLVSLDLSNFDTSNATSFGLMFSQCSSLVSLDLSNFDMSKATSYNKMFEYCDKLTHIKCKQAFKDWCITNQKIINLPTTMREGGSGTWEIIDGSQSVPVVVKFTDGSRPEYRKYQPLCERTTKTATSQTIELPSEGETYTFVNKSTLLEVRNYSNNCPSVTSFSYLFDGATDMKTLTFAKGMDTSKIENMGSMFNRCSKLVSLDLSSFDTSQCANFGYMFSSCSGLTSLILPDFSKGSLSSCTGFFYECSSLGSLDLSNFNTSNCTEFNEMFANCSSLVSLDLSNFDTSNCTSLEYMFYGCSSLVSLDLSNFDTSNAEYFDSMFDGCNKLTHIKCKQAFKDWCITKQDTISLPTAMREGGSGTWEIVG